MRRWLAAGFVIAAIAACGGDKTKPPPTSEGGSGGSGGGGDSGCTGEAQCGRLWDCGCVAATCEEAPDGSKAWTCPVAYPVPGNRCPSEAECQLDSGTFGECPAAGNAPRGMGACCTGPNDCASGLFCLGQDLGGYCSWGCETDADCASTVASPSPFKAGTKLSCMPTPAGGFCLPGSGETCTGPQDCNADEICTLAPADAGTPNVSSTRCMARYATQDTLAAGDRCRNQNFYECPQPATVGLAIQSDGRTLGAGIVYGCRAGICAEACDTTGSADCGDGKSCSPVYDWYDYFLNHPIEGDPGVCLGPVCGQLTFQGQAGDQTVDVSACGENETCSGIDDYAIGVRLTCHEPDNGAEPFGDCEQDPFFDKPCSTGFCLQRFPDELATGKRCNATRDCSSGNICVDTDGDAQGHCTPRGDPGLCSAVCSTDADCKDGTSCSAFSASVSVANARGTSYVPLCATASIFGGYYGTDACTSDHDCTKLGDTCSLIWGRSNLGLCLLHASPDTGGARCQRDDACRLTERCVPNADGSAAYCTDVAGLLTTGEACAKDAECLSGLCLDSDLRAPASGRNTFCASVCTATSQCGDKQACRTLTFDQVPGGNHPPVEPNLDTRVGLCLSLAPAAKSQICDKDADCGTGLNCDVPTGSCHDNTAVLGATCRLDEHCATGQICDNDLRRCVISGCDPSANAACPEGAVCEKGLGPVYLCVPQHT